MENNYLWDRSGEVDVEIEKLENLLSTMRYQPRPLEIPLGFRAHRRNFSPALAIAAAIALVAIALGIWLHFNQRQAAPLAVKDSQIDRKPPQSPEQVAATGVQKPEPPPVKKRYRESTNNFVAANKSNPMRVIRT